MSFSRWLEDNYPERVRNSAESYQLIKKAKRNTRFLSVIAIFLVCFPFKTIKKLVLIWRSSTLLRDWTVCKSRLTGFAVQNILIINHQYGYRIKMLPNLLE